MHRQYESFRSLLPDRSSYRMIERALWVAIVVLMVADIATTVVAISEPGLVESNALAAWFIAVFGATAGLTIKMAGMLAVAYPLYKIIPDWSRLGLLSGIVGAHAIAVVSNIELLLRYGLL